jgi:hypothetical protein
MEKQVLSFNEMLPKIEEHLKQAEKQLEDAKAIYMPEIVLVKIEQEVLLWESIYTAVEEYMHWTERFEADIQVEDEVNTYEINKRIQAGTDMVNSPKHYTEDKEFEVIDVIRDWLTPEEFRGYIKGNNIKYIARERLKNGDEDIKKTIFYLNYLMYGIKSDGSPQD